MRMTTGAAATSRCVRKYTAGATRNNITPTKNTRRPSRPQGKAGKRTLAAANNYINLLRILKRFKEARSLLRKTTPLAQRVLGEGHQVTLTMKKMKAEMLCDDDGATPDDLREAVEIFEEVYRTSRRLLGAAHPRVFDIELNLKSARAKLRAREDA